VNETKTAAIVQSSYIPWKGYFDLIAYSDVFVLFDDVQYTKRDWRSRNQIKTPNGLLWLSIPVQVKGKYFQKISEVEVADSMWAKNHWNSIRHAYHKARAFEQYESMFMKAYSDASAMTNLSEINEMFTRLICNCLNLKTEIRRSEEFELQEDKTEKLVGICEQLGANKYVSGPAASSYIDSSKFESKNIELTYFDYSNYPEYDQLYPPFEHTVSVLDLLFNVGMESNNYLKFGREKSPCQRI
jgi:WbqC-like protein family